MRKLDKCYYQFFYFLFFSIFLVIIKSTKSQIYPKCGNNSESLDVRISNLSTSFTFDHLPDLSQHQLLVTYEWEVEPMTSPEVDGFLYRLQDTDEVSIINMNKMKIGKPDFSLEDGFNTSTQLCDDDVEIYISSINGTTGRCQLPCAREYGVCDSSSICRYIYDSFKPLPKEERSVKLAASFGRHYEFRIVAYRALSADKSTEVSLGGVSVFCGHHLIETLGFDQSKALKFCDIVQEISDLSISAGPASSLVLDQLKPDLINNEISAVIKWKSPYDVVANKSVTRFLVKEMSRKAKLHSSIVAGKSSLEEEKDPFYRLQLDHLRYGEEYVIQVTSYVSRQGEKCRNWMTCEQYGTQTNLSIYIEDINACETNFCVDNITCFDLQPDDATAAICNCSSGFHGNGIRLDLAGGTGCTNFDSCLTEAQGVCASSAICTDFPPPSNGFNCSCPEGYTGDGYVAGTGCRDQSLVVSIAVAVPVGVIASCVVIYIIWKYRQLQERKLDLKFSKFFPSKPDPQPTEYGLPSQPTRKLEVVEALGQKWDIKLDRLDISDDVIGRGNFGIVQKATLRYDDGNDVIVAVKSLTGAYSAIYRSDFIAEINLMISIGKHDHILGVLGICSPHDPQLAPLLITQFMRFGDLLHVLWNARDPEMRKSEDVFNFTEKSVYKVASQVASGLEFLSSWKIIHGDVAARNILVGEGLSCKICDFGLANDVYRYGVIRGATERRVPFRWISPERMRGGEVPITLKSDQWSFGILLYEMVTLGSTPYPSVESSAIFKMLEEGIRMKQPTSCSDHLYSIMLRCWKWEAHQRPSFQKIQEFLKEVEKSSNDVTLTRDLLPVKQESTLNESGEVHLGSQNAFYERDPGSDVKNDLIVTLETDGK